MVRSVVLVRTLMFDRLSRLMRLVTMSMMVKSLRLGGW